MLAIARAMMSRPKLLLCDEPSMGLAPIITAELFRILGRLNADMGTAMLIVEQNANLALTVADRGYVLETGRIVASGTAAQLHRTARCVVPIWASRSIDGTVPATNVRRPQQRIGVRPRRSRARRGVPRHRPSPTAQGEMALMSTYVAWVFADKASQS